MDCEFEHRAERLQEPSRATSLGYGTELLSELWRSEREHIETLWGIEDFLGRAYAQYVLCLLTLARDGESIGWACHESNSGLRKCHLRLRRAWIKSNEARAAYAQNHFPIFLLRCGDLYSDKM